MADFPLEIKLDKDSNHISLFEKFFGTLPIEGIKNLEAISIELGNEYLKEELILDLAINFKELFINFYKKNENYHTDEGRRKIITVFFRVFGMGLINFKHISASGGDVILKSSLLNNSIKDNSNSYQYKDIGVIIPSYILASITFLNQDSMTHYKIADFKLKDDNVIVHIALNY